MDMMTRSAVLAASLVTVAIAAAAGWWFLSDTVLEQPERAADFQSGRDFDTREGSLRDEFGEDRSEASLDDRITIVTGRQLDIPPPPVGTVAGLPDGPQFGWDQPGGRQARPLVNAPAPLPRNTPAERVEADCRARGGGSYACRCLVRMARTGLSAEEFDFLSLTEELDPRPDRLSTAGLALTDLPALSVRLVELDANARRRCGSGLKP